MYQSFFSLTRQPFSVMPDPDFLFLSHCHQEAVAHLTYGLEANGGFVVLTGDTGTGKTMICHYLLNDMNDDTDVAFLLNPPASDVEILAEICDNFNIDYGVSTDLVSVKKCFDALSSWMLSNHSLGRKAVVLIDEAQQLSFELLEQLRLLTNIESDNQKPLQIILIGETQLQDTLQKNELRQLAQRITAQYHLQPLSQQESLFYIRHRLNIAGAKAPLFDEKALQKIAQLSGGIPRTLNQLSDKCLLSASTKMVGKVSMAIVKQVEQESDLSLMKEDKNKRVQGVLAVTLVAVVIFNIIQYLG
ncbi:MAG TPA: DUF2075 domain-containing protein [Psychromonas hadalis]|nr:DUF2075 domain-containing protein [Psychromonas hadalis]